MKFEMIEEDKAKNDLFFVCSLIEFISRKTKNHNKVIINKLGYERIKKIYELADIYHCENIEKVTDELIEEYGIQEGNYDKISDCKYRIPTYWEIGKVYKRLIIMVNDKKEEYVTTMCEVLSSWIIEKIDNYNSSMYYENPQYIYECYKEGKII